MKQNEADCEHLITC